MILKRLVVGPLYTNCYIIASEGKSEAAVIDPGEDAERILAFLKEKDLELKKIINTHGHFDHVSANDDLAKATGAKIYIHPQDLEPAKRDKDTFVKLEEGESVGVGDLQLEIYHTPGHTRGSISVLVGSNLFSGDLLFKDSVGRTDLPESSWEDLVKSLKDKIMVLPDDTRIYPGHGEETVLGMEKKTNPFLIGIQEVKS